MSDLVTGGGSAVGNLKIMRVIRLLRLAKLLRLYRLQRIITNLQDRYSINTNWLTLVRFAIGVLLLAHWFACTFHLVARYQVLSPNEITWVDHYFGTNLQGFSNGSYVDEYSLDPYVVYIAAVYYSMVSRGIRGSGGRAGGRGGGGGGCSEARSDSLRCMRTYSHTHPRLSYASFLFRSPCAPSGTATSSP